jgi:hypothetical protein
MVSYAVFFLRLRLSQSAGSYLCQCLERRVHSTYQLPSAIKTIALISTVIPKGNEPTPMAERA